jgi:hypothetical protein
MIQFEMWEGGRYRYTLGTDDNPAEALDAEQARGGRRLSITKISDGRRTPNFLTGQEPVKVDRDEQEEDEDFEEYA